MDEKTTKTEMQDRKATNIFPSTVQWLIRNNPGHNCSILQKYLLSLGSKTKVPDMPVYPLHV